MSGMYPDIKQIRSLLLSEPLFPNRYIGIFSGPNVFSENLGYMMSSVNIPTNTYNTKQMYIGGVMTGVVSIYEKGNVDMTIYNTGKEYMSIYKWGEMHYNQKTRCYGYMNDVYAELSIFEYDRTGNMVIRHSFHGCSIYTMGGIQLSYEEATAIETFQLALNYISWELEKY